MLLAWLMRRNKVHWHEGQPHAVQSVFEDSMMANSGAKPSTAKHEHFFCNVRSLQ
jgi:hypothetical protein